MALTSVAEAAGIAAVFGLSDSHQVALSSYATRADLWLRKRVGETNYAALLAQTATQVEGDLASFAANRYGAALYVLDRAKPVGRHVVSSTQIGDNTESAGSVQESDDWARKYKREALAALVDAGLYQRPTLVVGTAIAVDDE